MSFCVIKCQCIGSLVATTGVVNISYSLWRGVTCAATRPVCYFRSAVSDQIVRQEKDNYT